MSSVSPLVSVRLCWESKQKPVSHALKGASSRGQSINESQPIPSRPPFRLMSFTRGRHCPCLVGPSSPPVVEGSMCHKCSIPAKEELQIGSLLGAQVAVRMCYLRLPSRERSFQIMSLSCACGFSTRRHRLQAGEFSSIAFGKTLDASEDCLPCEGVQLFVSLLGFIPRSTRFKALLGYGS